MEKKVEELVFDDGSSLNTTKLAVKSDDHLTTAWYWFMIGNKKIASYYWQQLSMLQSLFSNKRIQGAMVRISVNGDEDTGREKAGDFVANLLPHLDKIHHPTSGKC